MILSITILALVTAQRLGELVLAKHNTRALKAAGAVEIGASHYPLIVAVHAAWLAGLWLLAWDRPISLPLLAVFMCLQLLRAWVIISLGARWTTRIIVLPGAALVRRGPYRFVSHPNYMIVAAEIAVLPLTFHLPVFALAFSAFNAVLLWIRVRAEGRALRVEQACDRSASCKSAQRS